MNPTALKRLDRKSLLALAQKHKIPQSGGLTKDQLIQKLTVKCEVQPSVKRQTSKKTSLKTPSVHYSIKKNNGVDLKAKGSSVVLPKSEMPASAAKATRKSLPTKDVASSIPTRILKESGHRPVEKSPLKNHQIKAVVSQPPAQKLKSSIYPKPLTASNNQPPSVRVAPPSPIIRLGDVKPPKSAARDTSSERPQAGGLSAAPAKLANKQVPLPSEYGKDRVVVLVRDPHWIHCYWELSRQTTSRAQTALGQDFETAQIALRLVKLGDRDCGLGEQIVREFVLPDGARNWYLDVPEPGTDYCVDVGFRSKNGRFYCMGRSNSVSTPRVAWGDQAENCWTEQDNRDAERLFALSGGLQPNAGSSELRHFFEDKLGHNPGSPAVTSLGSGGFGFLGKDRNFTFNLDADLVVHGTTEPSAKVTFQGEPIPLRPDGTFSLRFKLEDGRHIMPAVSVSCTGMEERTIVLAVERNTKTLEPVVHEEEE